MRLFKIFMSLLVLWNTAGVCLILFRYKAMMSFLPDGQSGNGQGHGEVTYPSTDASDHQSPATPFLESVLVRHRRDGRRPLDAGSGPDGNMPSVYFNGSVRTIGLPHDYISPYMRFPGLQDIRFNNVYWQTLTVAAATFYLYGAYYDDRVVASEGRRVIRVLTMVDMVPPPKVKCALWFNGGRRLGWSSSLSYELLWRPQWGHVVNGTLQPYLVSCTFRKTLAFGDSVPEMVSLVSSSANSSGNAATNNLQVRNGQRPHEGQRREFAVCVKGLDFADDLSLQLLEWVHLLRMLGADKILFYELQVHPAVANLLDRLEEDGLVEVLPLTLPGFQPNLPQLRTLYLHRMTDNKRLNEIIPYNDCLYRNLYRYKYLLLLDIDEVMMPLTSFNWSQLMIQIQSLVQANRLMDQTPSSYSIRNVYFFDDIVNQPKEILDIPSYLHFSRLVMRSARYTDRKFYVKCFHDVSRVRALHNHYPLSCLGDRRCSTFEVSPFMAHLQHYRRNCHDMSASKCDALYRNVTVADLGITRYSQLLVDAVQRDVIRYGLDVGLAYVGGTV